MWDFTKTHTHSNDHVLHSATPAPKQGKLQAALPSRPPWHPQHPHTHQAHRTEGNLERAFLLWC